MALICLIIAVIWLYVTARQDPTQSSFVEHSIWTLNIISNNQYPCLRSGKHHDYFTIFHMCAHKYARVKKDLVSFQVYLLNLTQ